MAKSESNSKLMGKDNGSGRFAKMTLLKLRLRQAR
jgi:hypothetical protein